MATASSHSLIPWNILTIHSSNQSAASELLPVPSSLGHPLMERVCGLYREAQMPSSKATVLEAPLFKNNQVFQVTLGFVNCGWGGPGDSGVICIASPYNS